MDRRSANIWTELKSSSSDCEHYSQNLNGIKVVPKRRNCHSKQNVTTVFKAIEYDSFGMSPAINKEKRTKNHLYLADK